MIVPIFPLPNVVLFPKTTVSLHIFEPRYRAMTREAIAGDRTIVVVLMQEGWETKHEKNPPVHEIACLGRIESYDELDQGKYNIVLAGIQRVRLVREIEHAPYRKAEVEMLEEDSCDDDLEQIVSRRNHLGGLFSRFTELVAPGEFEPEDLVPQFDFEAMVNMVATSLNLPAEDRQVLLEMDDLADRCDALLPVLQRHIEALAVVRAFEHIKPDDPKRN